MRKPHERWHRLLLRLLLVGLGCCLVPQFGPGQLPVVINRPPIELGRPEKAEYGRIGAVEWEIPPVASVLVFEPVRPPARAVIPWRLRFEAVQPPPAIRWRLGFEAVQPPPPAIRWRLGFEAIQPPPPAIVNMRPLEPAPAPPPAIVNMFPLEPAPAPPPAIFSVLMFDLPQPPPASPIASVIDFAPAPASPSILVFDPPLPTKSPVPMRATNEAPWIVPYGRLLTVCAECPTLGAAFGSRERETPHDCPVQVNAPLPPLTISRPPLVQFATPRPLE